MESVIFRFSSTIAPRANNQHNIFPRPFNRRRLRFHHPSSISGPKTTNIISRICCSGQQDIDSNSDADFRRVSELAAIPNEIPNPATNTSLNFTLSNSSNASAFSRGLLFPAGSVGSWDSQEVGSPVVKRFISDDEERWFMWYHGNSGDKSTENISDSMGLAVSSNGIHWERGSGPAESSGVTGLVMASGSDWWAFDTLSIRPSEVVVMSSSKVKASSAVYWLYYTGYCPEESNVAFKHDGKGNPERFDNSCVRIFKSLPGLAISQDGRHWARIEGDHHSGALLDVGSEREWDALFVANPHVVLHEMGDLRMYYHSMDEKTGEYGIGVARSRDGLKWLKLGKILGAGKEGCFDELGATNACVVKYESEGKPKYLMAYEGVGADGRSRIGLAVSSDGLRNWSRLTEEAVLMPSRGEMWDNNGVGSPYLVQLDGDPDDWRMYYRGVGNDGKTGIGMATSKGGDLLSFRKWSGFHP